MFKNSVSHKTIELLENLFKNNLLDDFFLVGGTAISLQIGHRISEDLDLFTDKEFSGEKIVNEIKKNFQIKPVHISDNSVEVSINGTKNFFMYWAYPLINDLKIWKSIRFADPVDLGIMKLLCLQGRSTKKDIIDLYFIDNEIIKIEDLIKIFNKHYPKDSFNLYSSLKDLINEEELEKSPMPKMIRKIDFNKCYDYVCEKIKKTIN